MSRPDSKNVFYFPHYTKSTSELDLIEHKHNSEGYKAYYRLQKMMGHSSIVTTEGYLKLELKRLERDFPSVTYKPVKSGFRDTSIRDTDKEYHAVVDGIMIN